MSNLLFKSKYLDKVELGKLNRMLEANGFRPYPGDDTGNGQHADGGYICNILSYWMPEYEYEITRILADTFDAKINWHFPTA